MSLKKFYLYTFGGEGVPIARKLQDEGVEVIVGQVEDIKHTLTPEESYKPEDPTDKERRLKLGADLKKVSGDKLIKMALSDKEPESAFFMADFNNIFHGLDEIRRSGMPGLYPTEDDRHLEVDRAESKKFVEKNYPDLEVAEVEELKKISEAEKFLAGTDSAWVLKGFDIDASTVVPTSDDPAQAGKEILDALHKNPKPYEKSGFELERKIEKPLEVTPQAVFNNGKFLGAIACIEAKRAGEKETGEMLGCAGDLVFELSKDSQLFKMAFPPAVFKLAKQHKGVFYWDAAILFDQQGTPFFSEFCANRPGYNCLYTEICMVGSAKGYFEALMESRNPYNGSEWLHGASVRLMSGAGGKKPKRAAVGLPVAGDMWGMDTVDGKTIGYSWETGVVTGGGNSPEHAMKRAVSEARLVDFAGKHYRKDLNSPDYSQAIMKRLAWIKKRGLI